MSDRLLGEIDAEILRLEAEIEVLRLTRAVIVWLAPAAPGRKPKQLLLAAPDKKPRKVSGKKPLKKKSKTRQAAAGQQVYQVNGVDIKVSERQFAVLELLKEASEGDCVPLARLLPIYDNRKTHLQQDMFQLRKRLHPAKSTVGFVKGEGYRLELVA